MTAPAQMYDHALDMLKGWHDIHAVDYAAKMSGDVSFDVPNGRVVALDDAGEFVPGLQTNEMAIFLNKGPTSLDVANDGGDEWYSTHPAGVCAGLVACQGYELQTTEFDAEQEYPPNTTLTAEYSLSDSAVGGLLTPGTVYTDPICGVVSKGVVTNAHRKQVVQFWTVWLPPTP